MVYSVRERCGRRLALEAHVDADIVSTVPESATPAALGYSAQVDLIEGHIILMRCLSFYELIDSEFAFTCLRFSVLFSKLSD